MMNRFLKTACVCALALVSAQACAAAGGGDTPGAPRARSDVMTAEQIDALNVTDMYSAVQRLHSNWLRGAGVGNDEERVGVFVDGSRVGGPSVLRQIPPTQVSTVRYVNERHLRAELTYHAAQGLTSAILIETGRARPASRGGP